MMVDGPHSPPGFARGGGAGDDSDPARGYEEYQPEPLDSLQREELRRRNEDPLRIPIAGETPRLVPWRRRVWPIWPSALDWRTFSEHSTSARGNEFPTPVDVNSSRRLRYIEPQFRI